MTHRTDFELIVWSLLDRMASLIDARMRSFSLALQEFLQRVLAEPVPADWHEQLAVFVQSSLQNGVQIAQQSVREIEVLIEERVAAFFARRGLCV
jgi:hypothetical protein